MKCAFMAMKRNPSLTLQRRSVSLLTLKICSSAASAPDSSLLHDITHQPPDWPAGMLGCDWPSWAEEGGGVEQEQEGEESRTETSSPESELKHLTNWFHWFSSEPRSSPVTAQLVDLSDEVMCFHRKTPDQTVKTRSDVTLQVQLRDLQ